MLMLKASNFSNIVWLDVSLSTNDPETLTWILECYLSQKSEQLVQLPHQIQNGGKIKDASGLQVILKALKIYSL